MYTQCPQCHTAFRVTATMLKAARGKVRCGRCAHVFNALTFLIDTEEASAAASSVQDDPEAAEAADEETPPVEELRFDDDFGLEDVPDEAAAASSDDKDKEEDEPDAANDDSVSEQDDLEVVEGVEIVEMEGDAAADEGAAAADIPESALEFTAHDLSKVFVEAPPVVVSRPPGVAPSADSIDDDDTAEHEILDIELETPASPEIITLEGDSVLIIEESGARAEFHTGEYQELDDPEAEDEVDAAPAAAAIRKARSTEAIDAEVRREIEKAFADDPTTRAEFVLPSGRRVSLNRKEDVEVEEMAAAAILQRDTARQRKLHTAWIVCGALLALALVIQGVHHNRQSLVRTAVGPFLTSVYGTLGAELSPVWNVRAFQLRQWGAAADPGANGTLRVRASVLNNAEHAQPYPLLRLTLQDRFGDRVAQRDVEPREYLPSAPQNGQLLGAGQRVDADIAIVDPGKDAVGFEIDVCLRNASAVTCANDDALRQTG